LKRIVICADGTWNQRDQVDPQTKKRRPTNVTKTARAVLPQAADGVHQVVYYHDGVGTRGPLDSLRGGAYGRGIEDNICNLYRFIVYNWLPGDELFFFGFSRGAYTVRSLAGFIKHIGLIEKDDDYYIPELFDLYRRSLGPDSAPWQHLTAPRPGKDGKPGRPRIQGTRPCPPIRFIGVWDTVGALRERDRFHRVGLFDEIQAAAHAVAIDERRRPFLPTLYVKPAQWRGTLNQAWFPGVHSDVGGSYSNDGLANSALHWVLGHAREAGLQLDDRYLSFFKRNEGAVMHDSLGWMYKLMRPLWRPIGQAEGADEMLHHSAMTRRALGREGKLDAANNLGSARYEPPNLEAYLAHAGAVPSVVPEARDDAAPHVRRHERG
jgi:uncharacterized protein (DUF2235 family)